MLYSVCSVLTLKVFKLQLSSKIYEAIRLSSNNAGKKVYTKTGDKGMSSLLTGERRPKSDKVFDALGNTDELSSHIGLVKEYALEYKHEYVDQLERIQCILQDIGSLIAMPKPKECDPERELRLKDKLTFNPRHIFELEEWIDKYSAIVPPLTNFILPGGGKISASLHIARTICRRAERSITPLATQEIIDENAVIYLNRLSDYLFTVARYACLLDNRKETIYIRPNVKKSY